MLRCAPVLILVTLGCGGGDDAAMADASVDARLADAAMADADTSPDAFDPCPGQVSFTGEYIDWDSDLVNFAGVPLADLVERGNTANSDMTSPNGRWELCVARATDLDFDLTHADYLDVILAMDADAHIMAPTSVRGVEPARRDTLFADELSLAVDAADALVLVDLRRANGDPVIGATVALGNAHDGAFTFDDAHVMQAGAVTTDDGTVLFANVALGSGTTTIAVTPPQGTTCDGRGLIPVVAATTSVASFACN